MGIGDWGLGIGDWGLGIGDWAQSPIPNPQSPFILNNLNIKFKITFIKNNKNKFHDLIVNNISHIYIYEYKNLIYIKIIKKYFHIFILINIFGHSLKLEWHNLSKISKEKPLKITVL